MGFRGRMGVEYDSMGMGTKEVGWKLNRRREGGEEVTGSRKKV